MKNPYDNLQARVFSFIAWLLMQAICMTSRLKVVGYENLQELLDSDKGFIIAIWHGRTMLPIYYGRGMGAWTIIDVSMDGEIQNKVVTRLGYKTIRGATNRGGIKAALTASKRLEEGGMLAITPDGPLGPQHAVHEGVIFLSQKAKCPIIPVGVGIRRRILAKSWDKYAIPLPFSEAVLVFGESLMTTEMEEGGPPPQELLKSSLEEVQERAQNMAGEVA